MRAEEDVGKRGICTESGGWFFRLTGLYYNNPQASSPDPRLGLRGTPSLEPEAPSAARFSLAFLLPSPGKYNSGKAIAKG